MSDILIVEDDADAQKALPSLLKSLSGLDAIVAPDFAAALEEIKKEPKFLILDLVIPGGNGYEILKYAHDNNLKTKCIIVSGCITGEKTLLGYPVLEKPIDLDKLIQFLKG